MHCTTLDPRLRVPSGRAVIAGIEIAREKALLVANGAAIGLLVAAGLVYPVTQLDANDVFYPMCLVLTLAFTWILGSWLVLRGTLFEPYPLFMLAAGMFNGGQAFLEAFGLNKGGMLGGRVPVETMVPGLYLVAISLLALHWGALQAVARKRPQPPDANLCGPARQKATRSVGWILLAVAAVPAFLLLRDSVSVVLDYGYVWLYRREAAGALIWTLSGLLIPGAIFLLAGSSGKRAFQALALAVAGVYAGANLFMGTRGAVTMSVVSVAWIFDRVGKRIPRWFMAVAAVTALLVFSLVRDVRETAGALRPSWSEQFETITSVQDPLVASVGEMGYSFVAVAHTLALVPQTRPFDFGVSYLYAAFGLVPNLGWEVHPGVAHGLLSRWLTETADPVFAASGGGLGYSFIAEAYLNFGWFGGPLSLLIMGYLVTRLFLLGDSQDPVKPALVASFLWSFLIFTRGESAIVFRNVTWYALIPYLMVTGLTVRSRIKSARVHGGYRCA
jgi:oligosaccharide repeat unit polymerase